MPERLLDGVLLALAGFQDVGRRLLRLSMTLPRWGDGARLFHVANEYCLRAAKAGYFTALLFVDVSPTKKRVHLYGIAVTDLSSEWLVREWLTLSGASAGGVLVTAVSGSTGPWNPENIMLRTNLGRVIGYALKPIPAVKLTLAQRAVGLGPFWDLWGDVLKNGGHAARREPDRGGRR